MGRFGLRSGGIELRLSDDDIRVLGLMGELLASVGQKDGDPAAERLSVAAYPEDGEAQADYDRYMAPELDEQRRIDRAAVDSSLEEARGGQTSLENDEAGSWLRVLNEARLVLAARLGIEEEGWGERDPMTPAMAFLLYLTEVQDDLIGVLSHRLGPPDPPGRRGRPST